MILRRQARLDYYARLARRGLLPPAHHVPSRSAAATRNRLFLRRRQTEQRKRCGAACPLATEPKLIKAAPAELAPPLPQLHRNPSYTLDGLARITRVRPRLDHLRKGFYESRSPRANLRPRRTLSRVPCPRQLANCFQHCTQLLALFGALPGRRSKCFRCLLYPV